MAVSDQKRKEISAWAFNKATEDAKSLGSDMVGAKFSSWLQERIWHYEKMAYLKIHNRESRMKK
jgi:hypothetical protein